MIDNSLKIKILGKITSSTAFQNSDKYSTLLTYLVESTIKGKIPKEYSIAIDVFDKDKNFNPSEDTIVRYYIHQLRKKINDYYETEGKNDEFWLVIPKGHYEVKFQPKPKAVKAIKKPDSPLIYVLIILLISAFAAGGGYFYKYYHLKRNSRIISEPINTNDPIWSDFFANDFPTVLLIGNHFLYQEYDNELQRYRFIIDHKITTENEYKDFIKNHPDRNLIKSDQGSLPLNSIFNLNDLCHVFYSFNKTVDIELSSVYMASQFDLTNINDRNIIYIGGFRNLRKFNYIMDKIPVSYKYSKKDFWRGKIIIPDDKTDSLVTFQSTDLKDGHYSDLGFIAKVPGNKQENYLILAGFAYPAQIEVVRMLSQNIGLSKIYEQTNDKYETFPDYSFMVIEVLGLEYSALESKVIYFKEIKNP